MRKDEIKDSEIFKASALILSLTSPEEFLKEFPSLSRWVQKFPDKLDKIQDQIITEAQNDLKNSKLVTIKKTDLFDLYAYSSSCLGFEQMSKNYPRVRLLILNLLDEKELTVLMEKIRIIENQLILKFSN